MEMPHLAPSFKDQIKSVNHEDRVCVSESLKLQKESMSWYIGPRVPARTGGFRWIILVCVCAGPSGGLWSFLMFILVQSAK